MNLTLRNRLIEALASCQIIEAQLLHGAALGDKERRLVGDIASYVEAWRGGTSREKAWKLEDMV